MIVLSCLQTALISLKAQETVAYTLTVMVPNEKFAELIYSGTATELDAEDLAVLQRKALPVSG